MYHTSRLLYTTIMEEVLYICNVILKMILLERKHNAKAQTWKK